MLRGTVLSSLLLLLFAGAAPASPQPTSEGAERPVGGIPQGTSLLGRELVSLGREPGTDIANPELDSVARLLAKQQELPDDPELAIELARAYGERWQYRQAIDVLDQAITKHPANVLLYRYRGHRLLSLRQFDRGLADLERATALLDAPPAGAAALGEEQRFDVWYHLGLARYLRGEFADAARAYARCQQHAGDDDAKVAVTHWRYMALRRAGQEAEAAALLVPISDAMNVTENGNYHQLLLMYKGERAADDLLRAAQDDGLALATSGYGIGNWFLLQGERARALELFERITASGFWPAFGFIAAEAELVRSR